ncbi:hypothetical protein DFH06DRAFT_597827 [Mycena polygramma]|nr:hypothetical protein DFH06DRAFT_597827 [Mycena polygramma]
MEDFKEQYSSLPPFAPISPNVPEYTSLPDEPPSSCNVPISQLSDQLCDVSDDALDDLFDGEIKHRDQIHGLEICVLCGMLYCLTPCHIIPKGKESQWPELRARKYAPAESENPETEPRNAILLCPTHHDMFSSFRAFVRYSVKTKAYIWFEFTQYDLIDKLKGETSLRKSPKHPHHLRKLHLDPAHALAPLNSLFIVHEWRARALHPFESVGEQSPERPVYSASLSEVKAQLDAQRNTDSSDVVRSVYDEAAALEPLKEEDRAILRATWLSNSWRTGTDTQTAEQ